MQFSLRKRVNGGWAKRVNIRALQVSYWTENENERWISKLPEAGEPPDLDASTEENLAYKKKKDAGDNAYGNLMVLAHRNNCELIAIS